MSNVSMTCSNWNNKWSYSEKYKKKQKNINYECKTWKFQNDNFQTWINNYYIDKKNPGNKKNQNK